jgi:hypothetical protein
VSQVAFFSRLTLSGAALVLANLFPIAGVVLFDWRVFEVVFLFWAENVVIGILAVPRIFLAYGGPLGTAPDSPIPALLVRGNGPDSGFTAC